MMKSGLQDQVDNGTLSLSLLNKEQLRQMTGAALAHFHCVTSTT